MFEQITLRYFIYFWIAVAIVLFPVQLFISAPYGRHTKTTWGPMLSNQLGWILMEGWALIAFWVVYLVFFNSNVYSFFLPYFILFIISTEVFFSFTNQYKRKADASYDCIVCHVF
jgi:hypothetical protein